MDEKKRRKLEDRGWKVGTAREFLGLSDAEDGYVEIKLALSGAFSKRRRELGWTQEEVAARLGSSQSRIAKMEAGDRSVSIDLLLRGLLGLGATREDIAGVLRPADRPAGRRTTRKQIG